MKQRIRTFENVLLALFMVLMIALMGCERGPSEIFKIGVIGPLTGEGATYGAAMKRGIDLALEEVNAEGGIDGVQIKAIYRDSKLLPKEAISAFHYLTTSENVPAILGAAGSSISLALAPFANEAKVVLFSSISTADALKDAGEYFFRNVPPNRKQAETAAYFARYYLKMQKAAIFYENNDYGINMMKVFGDSFTRAGGKIVIDSPYESGQSDFRSLLFKIKEKNPEIIYIPGTYQENALILRQGKEAGIDATFVGGDGAYSPQLLKIAGDTAEGFYCTLMSLPPKEKSLLVSQFYDKYSEKYGDNPDVYSAYTFDAVKMVLQAVKEIFDSKNLKHCSGEDIKNTLLRLEYEGITGVTKFDEYGEPTNRFYSLYTVQKGEFVPLDWSPSQP